MKARWVWLLLIIGIVLSIFAVAQTVSAGNDDGFPFVLGETSCACCGSGGLIVCCAGIAFYMYLLLSPDWLSHKKYGV